MNRVLIVAAVLVTSCACTTEGEPRATDHAQATSAPTEASSSTSAKCDYGPWARHCPEAYWARAVVAEAGFTLERNTGSALVANTGDASVYFWAFEPDDPSIPLRKAIAGEGYERLTRIKTNRIYTDGIKLAWDIHGLYVWLEGGPFDSLDDVGRRTLKQLIAATRRVPYPLPQS